MTPNATAWACALNVLKEHGDRAAVFVCERIGALASAGDMAGVEIWKDIALRLDQLEPNGRSMVFH